MNISLEIRKLIELPWSKERDMALHNLYARESHERRAHHQRFVRYVTNRKPLLSCQECHGEGGYTEIIDYEIGGPHYECGWCEGTGYVTPHLRGEWLKYKRDIRAARKAGIQN